MCCPRTAAEKSSFIASAQFLLALGLSQKLSVVEVIDVSRPSSAAGKDADAAAADLGAPVP